MYKAISCCLLLVLVVGCQPGPPPERTWSEADGHRFAALTVPTTGAPGFTPRDPQRTGLTFTNTLSQEEFLRNRHYVNGSGVAIGDVDGDEWPDVYLARLSGPNQLFRNLGGEGQPWQFEDITAQAGVAAADRYS
ncbi:MAG: VCBS repeat-containing protein, partial [Bacteroidota bacterium]